MILAQVPAAGWPEIGSWMIGLIAVLGVVNLALGVVKVSMDLFGRKQSVEAIISQREALLRTEIQQLHLRLSAQRQDTEQRFSDLNVERQRNLESLHEKINGVVRSVEFIRGKMAGE